MNMSMEIAMFKIHFIHEKDSLGLCKEKMI